MGAILALSALAPVPAQASAPTIVHSLAAQADRAAIHLLPTEVVRAGTARKVQTTANLNLRSTPSTKGKKLAVVPKGTVLTVAATKSGWSQVRHAGKTGWVSGTYLRGVTKALKAGDLGKTTARLTLRERASAASKALATVPKAGIYTVKKVSGGYARITSRGKSGWVSGKYLSVVAKKPGREIYIDRKYTSNRAGLTDRYWTKVSGGDLYESVNGKQRIGDIPRNSVVYRDVKLEKTAGSVKGWIFVRTQGMSGWMKTSQLARTSTAATAPGKYSAKQVIAQKNGKIPERMLVAIGWDREKTLIAAPALKDLNRLNAAFKKKFGRNLDIDLAYRTRATQDAYWEELGPYVAARPGTSNHGWGTAIDVPETYNYSFRGKYYKWLKANSKKYNWVHRKILEEGSPYAEAWHFEYKGR
ncbi:SH3 domain-containing protein [Paeniglutamicibacter sp. MACA_103]|uniref:SH3 domain-containing protein n=1 Tax=Paeniglutamicibacter sp. MACA_103 TaxID=3377337 RepID=UPI0038954F39